MSAAPADTAKPALPDEARVMTWRCSQYDCSRGPAGWMLAVVLMSETGHGKECDRHHEGAERFGGVPPLHRSVKQVHRHAKQTSIRMRWSPGAARYPILVDSVTSERQPKRAGDHDGGEDADPGPRDRDLLVLRGLQGARLEATPREQFAVVRDEQDDVAHLSHRLHAGF